jgi:flagellar biosynthesis protein FlhF
MAELERLRAEVREVKFTLTSNLHRDDRNNSPSMNGLNDLDAELYDSPYYETYLHLANLGLSPEIARSAVRAAITSGAQTRNIHDLARIGLVKTLPSMIMFGDDPLAPRTTSPASQSAVALVGPTGVGKTTTIAKLAARAALRERKRVELITLDTYRIAAVEQLRTYAEIIGAGFHVPRSVLELNALVQRFSGQATVLIDTIGRSARDLADQMELADYLRNSDQIVKCLAVQATTHPTDATLAIEKFSLFGINELVITKLDETGRPGSAISTAAAARLPLAYLCTGQRVPEDIEKATAESLADHTLQTKARAMAA